MSCHNRRSPHIDLARRLTCFVALGLVAVAGACGPRQTTAPVDTARSAPGGGSAVAIPQPAPWQELFDRVGLGRFRVTGFGGEDEVEVVDGRLLLDFGVPLAGVTWTGDFPTDDYEVEVVAARLDGSDFFCGLTFPVRQSHASLILGGWGGALCGISSIDGKDASDNDTRRFLSFERNRDYRVMLRVGGGRVAAGIDGEWLWDLAEDGSRLSVRAEVLPSRPFGIASFATRAAISSVRLRRLPR